MTTQLDFKNEYLDAILTIDPHANLVRAGDLPDSPELLRAREDLCARFSWAIPSPAAVRAIHACVTDNNLAGIIEIGAGNGYWAHCLTQIGLSVIAVDSGGSHDCFRSKHWHPVIRGGPPHAARHPDRALFLCWPPMTTHKPFADRLWRRRPQYTTTLPWDSPDRDADYRAFCATHGGWHWWNKQIQRRCGPTNMGGASVARYTGEWVIYIGESEGGCTGDDTMWELLNRDFTAVDRALVFSYSGLHDELVIYRRGQHEECE